jgi:hypothetical protein
VSSGGEAARISVVPFEASDASRWDALVLGSPSATLLHSRRFLDYHGRRFADRSLLVLDGRRRLRAVLPAAAVREDPKRVVSHPGATYGGLVLAGRESGVAVPGMLRAVCAHYRAAGFEVLDYRAVPPHLQRRLSQVDVYALQQLSARLVRRELWNVIDLNEPRTVRSGRRAAVRRASAEGVRAGVEDSTDAYRSFHELLERCLRERHAATPVHTLDEMLDLRERFPVEIRLWLARSGDELLAGAWLFDLGHALHLQYSAATESGRVSAANDLLIDSLIGEAEREGKRYFSFGASTEPEDQSINEGLFEYKASFGAGTAVLDRYRLYLTAPEAG